MGCACGKGKSKKLNNIDSMDHLANASEVYVNHVQNNDITTLSDDDKFIIIQTYKSLYPNQKMEVTLEQALITLAQAHNTYTENTNGKKTKR
jgi:hypothetical protein